MGKFILSDLSRERQMYADPSRGDMLNEALLKFGMKHFGECLITGPGNQYTMLDLTGPPGRTSGVFFPLVFWLRRQGYQVHRADETIDVTPQHTQYYQATHKQKEELETKIKTSIGSVAQAVADFELLSHDERKYREFLRYFGYRTQKELDEESKKKMPEEKPSNYEELKLEPDVKDDKKKFDEQVKKHTDSHAIRAVFIDQVDVHTGDVSMRNIVQRWPTLITDFMTLADEDTDPDKIKNKLKISKAEGVVLATKNKLFNEWKRMFAPEIKARYERIKELQRSRKKSIEEYREWVKPYIARHRLLSETLSRPNSAIGGRIPQQTFFVRSAGHAASFINTTIWLWKEFVPPDFARRPGELLALSKAKPYDDFCKRELIWNPDYGLVSSYPWITKQWVEEQRKDIEENWMWKNRFYYVFLEMVWLKSNTRFPDGAEIEDGMFFLNTLLFSQNAMLAKLLELKAKQYEMEKYVDDLLGLRSDFLKNGEKEKWKPKSKIRDLPYKLGLLKHGPYETNFDERITKGFMIPSNAAAFGPIVAFMKEKFGFGKVT